MKLQGSVLVPGKAAGALLRLEAPISFWGGVDPATGNIIDPTHPQRGASIAGRIIALQRSVGSSSGSSVLLELLANSVGPAGVILGETDLILTLGAVVAREMNYAAIPVVGLEGGKFESLPEWLRITEDGCMIPVGPTP